MFNTNKRKSLLPSILPLSIGIASILMLSGCTNYEPVAAGKCPEVVKHAKKVLGAMAPDAKTMMADCKAATDSERGCVMAATKKGALAQCMQYEMGFPYFYLNGEWEYLGYKQA